MGEEFRLVGEEVEGVDQEVARQAWSALKAGEDVPVQVREESGRVFVCFKEGGGFNVVVFSDKDTCLRSEESLVGVFLRLGKDGDIEIIDTGCDYGRGAMSMSAQALGFWLGKIGKSVRRSEMGVSDGEGVCEGVVRGTGEAVGGCL